MLFLIIIDIQYLAQLHFSGEQELLSYHRHQCKHPRLCPHVKCKGKYFKVLEFQTFCILSCVLTLAY